MTLQNLAADYVSRGGLSVIPVKVDGSKRPALPSWKELQERRPSREELQEWFSRSIGIAVIAGQVSGGLEVIDFDQASFFEPWFRMLPEKLRAKLCVVKTPKGYHVFYRCPLRS